MTNQKNQITALFPLEIKEDKRIINEYGGIETIYGIERDGIREYFSTIATDDVRFPILKTYFVSEKGEETTIEKITEKRKNLLENLEKPTLNYIEKEMGFNALASQFN